VKPIPAPSREQRALHRRLLVVAHVGFDAHPGLGLLHTT